MNAPHPEDCACADCLLTAEVNAALDYPTEIFLHEAWAAWSSADKDPALRSALWSAIFRVETARRDGDVDGHAEDELRALVGRRLLLRRVQDE